MTNATFTLPAWAVTVVVILSALERIISLKLLQKLKEFLLTIWIFIKYHNDRQYYKDCRQREEIKRQLARDRASKGAKYSKLSVAEILAQKEKQQKRKKPKKENTDDTEQ